MKVKAFSQKQLRTLCSRWQKELRLQDWAIDISYVRWAELPDGKIAQVRWNLNRKSCVIQIMDPRDYHGGGYIEHEIEDSIIHELLHLHLIPISTDDAKDIEVEQAIESIGPALLRLSRQRK